MKKICIFLLLPLGLLFSRLNAQSSHGNITIVSTGLKVDSAFLVVSNKKVLTSEVAQGVKLYMDLTGIHGFSIRDGKSFPGCSMRVLDDKKKTILNYEDLFSGDEYKDGVDQQDVKIVQVNLTVGSPMMIGVSYTWEIKLWDKISGGELIAKVPVRVIAALDVLGIKKSSGGLTCENAYVISDGIMETNLVAEGQKLTFVFSGMKGYNVSKEKTVRLGAKVVVKNNAGKNVLEYGDLFKESESFDVSKAETITMFLTIGDPMMKGELYTWIVRLWDKSTEKWVEASIPLEVMAEH